MTRWPPPLHRVHSGGCQGDALRPFDWPSVTVKGVRMELLFCSHWRLLSDQPVMVGARCVPVWGAWCFQSREQRRVVWTVPRCRQCDRPDCKRDDVIKRASARQFSSWKSAAYRDGTEGGCSRSFAHRLPTPQRSNPSVSPEYTSSPVVGPGALFTDQPGPSWMCGALTATYAKKGFRVASGSASTSLIHASEVLPMTEVE